MIVIADSNLLISGLYNPNGAIVEILTSKSKIQLTAPDFIYVEINHYLADIAAATGKSKIQIKNDLKVLTEKITFYKSTDIQREFIRNAFEIVKDIDEDDLFFVALHLQTKHKIWTGDKQLINGLLAKGYDICVTTKELKKMLYKKD